MKFESSVTRLFLTTRDTEVQKKGFHINTTANTPYHTRHAFSATMGWPGLQFQVFWNSGMFCTTPSTRYFPGECGSTLTNIRAYSGRQIGRASCREGV